MKIAIELFCGSGSFGNVAGKFGYNVLSLDNRKRKGICEPTIRSDILKVRSSFFNSLDVKILWAGLPCDIWSYASGGFHLDKEFQPKTKKAVEHLKIFDKTIEIILECKPDFYFIENPRGSLKKYPGLINFLEKTNGIIKECTLSSYGFPTKKPTIIMTNFRELELKKMDSYGRGNKNKVPGTFDNLTKAQRQKTPEKLISDILKQVEKAS